MKIALQLDMKLALTLMLTASWHFLTYAEERATAATPPPPEAAAPIEDLQAIIPDASDYSAIHYLINHEEFELDHKLQTTIEAIEAFFKIFIIIIIIIAS